MIRIILLIAFIICSLLSIAGEFFFPLQTPLQLTLNICTLLSGGLMFLFYLINENKLTQKIKEYYQYSFVKDDTIKKLENEVNHKNEVIIDLQDKEKSLSENVERLTYNSKNSNEIELLERKNKDLNLLLAKKEEDLASKENEINTLKLEVKNWCNKAEELNHQIAKTTEHTDIIDSNHKETETDNADKTKKECLEFLEMIKWSNHNFNCSKCGNHTFNTLENLNSRKCTKCNHIESAMAHTLYMGVRFPLDKAFKITKSVINNPKVEIEQLIEETGLTKNTCWKFKNKVIDQIADFKKLHKRNPEHWEEIIYIK